MYKWSIKRARQYVTTIAISMGRMARRGLRYVADFAVLKCRYLADEFDCGIVHLRCIVNRLFACSVERLFVIRVERLLLDHTSDEFVRNLDDPLRAWCNRCHFDSPSFIILSAINR